MRQAARKTGQGGLASRSRLCRSRQRQQRLQPDRDAGTHKLFLPRLHSGAGRALHLRVERQTLRRLPRTGGALFTIRVWLAPLGSLADDPARLAAFEHAWRSATPELRAYKRFDLYDDLVEAFLRDPKPF